MQFQGKKVVCQRCTAGSAEEWMMEAPTCGYWTHVVCVMDPKKGEFRWVRKLEEGEVQVEEVGDVYPVYHRPGRA